MTYVPNRGDVAWLDFDLQIGREQAGRRPALTLPWRRRRAERICTLPATLVEKACQRLSLLLAP